MTFRGAARRVIMCRYRWGRPLSQIKMLPLRLISIGENSLISNRFQPKPSSADAKA
jgi:hypothetical protein